MTEEQIILRSDQKALLEASILRNEEGKPCRCDPITCSSKPLAKDAKTVVIVGGAYSSIKTAEALVGNGLRINIVQANSFVERQVAACFFLANPDCHKQALFALESEWLPDVSYIVGEVISLDEQRVTLRGGATVDFDACVLAVGWTCSLIKPRLGISRASREAEVEEAGAAIRSAKSVVVVGAGPVGVELAEQIRDVVLPETRVTLLCRSGVLPNFNKKTQEQSKKCLKRANIEILFDEIAGEIATSLSPGHYKLQSGAVIQADVLLPAFGTLQTSFLDPELLDGKGQVIVNEWMQCPGHPKLFAVGCNNLNKFRSLEENKSQAQTAATAILSFLVGLEAMD